MQNAEGQENMSSAATAGSIARAVVLAMFWTAGTLPAITLGAFCQPFDPKCFAYIAGWFLPSLVLFGWFVLLFECLLSLVLTFTVWRARIPILSAVLVLPAQWIVAYFVVVVTKTTGP